MARASVELRVATEADYPDIAAFLDRIFEPRPYEQRLRLWRWRHDDNPHRVSSLPHFLLATRAGQIVAVQGLLPLKLKVADRQVVVSCSCDLAADPTARGAGMRVKAWALSRDLSPLHFSTSANEVANQLTLALGGHEVPGGRRRFLQPLRLERLLPHLLRPRLPASLAALTGTLAGYPGTVALAARRAVRRRACPPGSRIAPVERFDQRFTAFGERLVRPHAVAVVRDRDYLDWRYARYPFPGVETFMLVEGEALLGYAAMHASTDADGLPFAALLELAVERGQTARFAALLDEFVQRAVGRGAHYAIARAPAPEWESSMVRRGFLLRPMVSSPATYKNNDTELPESILGGNTSWYLSLGDGDGCFYLR